MMMKFPDVLYEMLEAAQKEGFDDIVSWLPDGKTFRVHQKLDFVQDIMPRFFGLSKYKSYQRNLNLWGFFAVGTGPRKGDCSHPHFLRNDPKQRVLMVYLKKKQAKAGTTGGKVCKSRGGGEGGSTSTKETMASNDKKKRADLVVTAITTGAGTSPSTAGASIVSSSLTAGNAVVAEASGYPHHALSNAAVMEGNRAGMLLPEEEMLLVAAHKPSLMLPLSWGAEPPPFEPLLLPTLIANNYRNTGLASWGDTSDLMLRRRYPFFFRHDVMGSTVGL